MIPVYFPFTYLSNQTASALYACFKQIAVYQPSGRATPENMKRMAKEGVIDLRIPIEKEDEALMAACREYRDWGNLHQKDGLTLFKAGPGAIPFFDDSFTQKIRTDIEHYPEGGSKTEPLEFTARIFIQIAQEYDRQQDELAKEFHAIDTREQDLFSQLLGGGVNGPGKKSTPRPPDITLSDDYMIKERIKAWLYLIKPDKHPSGFFLTGRQSFWDLVMDIAPEAQPVFDFPSIPVPENTAEIWPQNMTNYLDTLIRSPWPLSDVDAPEIPDARGNDQQMAFKLAVIPGLSSDQFFSRFFEPPLPQNGNKDDTSVLKNTLIGLAVLR